ncbi:MAG: cell division protein FtsA [Candidatus Andersenbacteria bacterium]|nr:cell division protein FtsA [Candidatus Andersenbacteria bacterium]
MARGTHYIGIDVGSSVVRVVVASLEAGKQEPTILGVGACPMAGMQKGVITDVEEAAAAMTRALDMAERISGVPVERAYVSVNGSHISSQNSRGVIAVSRADGEITPDDVARVINAAQAISMPNNREILHVLPQNFLVDGQEHIHDPIGMTGVRLEVETHIIEGSAPFIKNLAKVVNQAGVHIEDFVFSPLAASAGVLEKRQKELGVALVDLGAGTTSLVVYEEGQLLHTAVLPVGSSHITNDIAIGLRTSIDIAEAIKVEHGTALSAQVKENEMIVVEGDSSEQESVSRKEVANIISARLEELFQFVDKELKRINRSGLLPAGVVLTGGGSHMEGVIELAKKKLRLPVKIGRSRDLPGLSEKTGEPSYAVAIGLIYWALDQERRPASRVHMALPDIGNTVHKVKDWFRTFLP